ncbi:MAG: class I SAM-dependent methyltransferase [bacterium]|nr:class I SAM-dependent methyltransferase [bacterium]
MVKDNTTPMSANEYDKEIINTIPYYPEFYSQTIDVIEQCGFTKIEWLDLGCGTGELAGIAFRNFSNVRFVLVDPSDKMLDQAKAKLKNEAIEYYCCSSTMITFEDQFNVVTAIQSHHYLKEAERIKATEAVYHALKNGGIYICFENVIPEDEEVKETELARWGRYQQRHGKSKEEAKAHNARCGVNYFPLTVNQHIQLLKQIGFKKVHIFWYSYMQMGIYGIK